MLKQWHKLAVVYNSRPPSAGSFPLRTRNGTRVRWDAAERALLVEQSRIVLAAKPGESFKDVVAEAMLSLPAERRRKVDTKTVLWVRERDGRQVARSRRIRAGGRGTASSFG